MSVQSSGDGRCMVIRKRDEDDKVRESIDGGQDEAVATSGGERAHDVKGKSVPRGR